MIELAVLVVLTGILAQETLAETRSGTARYQFRKIHPCPATQSRQGPCPGYVVDHIIPLCAGGPDHPSNMQWQRSDLAKIKDQQERKSCHQSRP